MLDVNMFCWLVLQAGISLHTASQIPSSCASSNGQDVCPGASLFHSLEGSKRLIWLVIYSISHCNSSVIPRMKESHAPVVSQLVSEHEYHVNNFLLFQTNHPSLSSLFFLLRLFSSFLFASLSSSLVIFLCSYFFSLIIFFLFPHLLILFFFPAVVLSYHLSSLQAFFLYMQASFLLMERRHCAQLPSSSARPPVAGVKLQPPSQALSPSSSCSSSSTLPVAGAPVLIPDVCVGGVVHEEDIAELMK